jgi:nucleoside-diphosphate-sugar epimerase
MRVAFIGGTYYLGPATVPLLAARGHEVVVAHSGAHEHPSVQDVEHFHGDRGHLLAPGGPVERWVPDVLIDTFAGGATADKGRAVAECAARCGAPVVAVSSMDVYEHVVHAGMADWSGIVALPPQRFPITEDAPLREGPYPGGSAAHDNVAMEAALRPAGRVTVLRPGAIYGPFAESREWYFINLVRRGIRDLPLPGRGQQLFHRVAVERVARAIVAAAERGPDAFWACNVVDPYDWTFAGLAGEVGRLLEWEWEPREVPVEEIEHPWAAAHPIIGSDRRLREVLGVRDHEPDPRSALAETVAWLWEHRARLAAEQ